MLIGLLAYIPWHLFVYRRPAFGSLTGHTLSSKNYHLSTQNRASHAMRRSHSLLLGCIGNWRRERYAGSGLFMPPPTLAAHGLWCPLTCVPLLRAPAVRGYASVERSSVCVPG
jgi:hypothetical protein